MMSWRFALSIPAICFACGVNAASPAADIDIAAAERYAPERLRELVFDLAVTPRWIADTDDFWYRYRDSTGLRYQLVEPRRRSRRQLLDARVVAKDLAGQTSSAVASETLALDDLTVSADLARIDFSFAGRRYSCRVGDCRPKPAVMIGARPSGRLHASRSPDGRFEVFVREHDLYLIDESGRERRLTADGEPLRSFAIDPLSPYDQRGTSPVRWFGPGSSRFYVQRWDWRGVAKEHVVDALATPRPALRSWPSSHPGEEILQRHELWVFDAATGAGRKIEADRWPGQMIGHTDLGGGFGRAGVTGVWPSADGATIKFVRISRGYRERELCIVDFASGAVRTLLAERDPLHIDIRYAEMMDIAPGGDFVWLTQRDGWKHIDRHAADGRRLNSVTSGDFVVEQILAADAARGEIFFTAMGRESGENPHYRHTYRAALDGSGVTLLDPGEGNHRNFADALSPSRDYLVDNVSRPDMPARSVLRDRNGNVVLDLEAADTRLLDAAGWKAPERFVVKAADGTTDLHGVLYKPFNFDPERRYPVIAHVYNGPGTQAPFLLDFDPLNPYEMATPQALAQLGYIVVQPSTRGSSTSRHRDFALFGYGNPRDFGMPDLAATIQALAGRHKFIDLDRAGITGYSGGGMMSVTAILTYPDLFKVAVAGAGTHDMNIYEQNSTEYQFGFPRKDLGHAGYPANSQLAAQLRGKLLLVHGDQDRDVTLSHTLGLADALIGAGKSFDMMIIPGGTHTSVENSQTYRRMLLRYFKKHLPPCCE